MPAIETNDVSSALNADAVRAEQPLLVLANSLKWLAPEIDASLHRARALIDQQEDAEELELDADAVLAELKLVQGALHMASCYGGALLAEELCAAVQAVADGKLQQPDAALAAVSGATLQLSDYLDALRHGAADRAAVLQPAVGELRLACGRVAATEADLFVRQMQLIDARLPLPPAITRIGDAAMVARQVLPTFQVLLLQWLKGVDVGTTLLKLRKVGDQISTNATLPNTVLLWTAFAAAIDSLVMVPDAESLELKRWVGRLGQQIKLLVDQGEAAAAQNAPEIAWRLLAHAAPIHHRGSRWLMLRHYLPLDTTLPIEPALSEARRQLRGPNTRLLEKVAEEVRADLAQVKDGLDLALRSGGLSTESQGSLAERLARIANTLLMLGLPQLEHVLRNQSGELASLGADRGDNQGQWMRVATALLRVEHSLETALFGPLRQIREEPQRELVGEMTEVIPHAQDLREGVAALLREMLVDLAKLKARLDAYLKGNELRDAEEPVQMLSEVASGLVILDQMLASQLTAELRDWLRQAGPRALRSEPVRSVHFAEAVAALELYLEALQDSLPQPERMLEMLKTALQVLVPDGANESNLPLNTLPVPPPNESRPSLELLSLALPEAPPATANVEMPGGLQWPEFSTTSAAPSAELVWPGTAPAVLEPLEPVQSIEAAHADITLDAPALQAAPEAPASSLAAGDQDPEIREIFLEEGHEVLAALRRAQPLFHRDPGSAALGEIRRAFHTLKGSGRMVGATRIGEFGWCIEHLLNRCIEGSLPANRAVVAIVDEAIALLPGLLDAFRDGESGGQEALQKLIARAHFLASGRAPEMVELAVLDVFRADALDRLGDIERWLVNADETFIDPETVRALHTIKGSAAVVNAEPLSQLAGGLEAVLKQVLAAELPVPPEVRAVVVEALPVLRRWTLQAGQASDVGAVAEWLARVDALRSFLPPPGDSRSLVRREALVNVAFDHLQTVEQRLVAWTVAPMDTGLAQQMAEATGALAAAVENECLPLARGAEALTERLRADDLAQQMPDARFFMALTNALEHFYQFLDSYREGNIRDSGRELAAKLRTLPLSAVSAPAATDPAAPLPEASQSAAPELASTIAAIEVDEAPVQQIEVVADAFEPLADALPPSATATRAAPPVPLSFDAIDGELAALFVEEARELLAVLNSDVPAWQPPLAPPLSIAHALHTLTGSARMVGYSALGDVSQSFDRRLQVLGPEVEVAVALRVELMAILPVFGQAIDAFEQAQSPLVVVEVPSEPALELATPEPLPAEPQWAESVPFEPVLSAAEPFEPAVVEWVSPESIVLEQGLIPPEAMAEPVSEPLPESPLIEPAPSAPLALELAPELTPVVLEPVTALTFDVPAEPWQPEPPLIETQQPVEPSWSESVAADAPIIVEHTLTLPDDAAAGQLTFGGEPAPPSEQAVLPALPSLLDGMQQFWPERSDAAPELTLNTEPEVPSAKAAAETIDPELATIFIGEAREMLEAIDNALGDWRRDVSDLAAVAELQRALHTLKGGARMTGFMQMGDVTHAMESRLSEILAIGSAPTEADHLALKADLEELESLNDALARSHYAEPVRGPEPARALLVSDDPPEDRGNAAPADLHVANAAELLTDGWKPSLFWQPPEDATAAARRELARVPVESLDAMLNEAGEISIYRSRLEQQNALLVVQLAEMRQTVLRLRDQLRLMDIETDAQIAARGFDAKDAAKSPDRYDQDFDPLEMDRYSRMQELSRALAEAVGDLSSLHLTMDQGVNDAQALLLQQGRINTAVQQGLMSTLMVPFSRQVARLQRVVRQTAQEQGKSADALFEGVESELDRNVLERMTAPLEHLLRNAVVHGLETPEARSAAGKPAMGTVTVRLKREGTQLLMEVADDGQGLNFAAIRTRAIERGLLPIGAELGDDEIARFIFEAGFSTAEKLTQSAGRGVGMDVVASEVKQLGGSLELRSDPGQGTRLSIRLPLSLALSQALMVKVGEETYALPLVAIEGIGRIPREAAGIAAGGGESLFNYAGHDYRVRSLAELIDVPTVIPEDSRTVPAVLVRLGEGIAGGERRAALLVDQLIGNREVVSKAIGPQLSSISGLSAATILPSGEVVLILDPAALIIDRARRRLIAEAAASRASLEQQGTQSGRLIMVVDDSVTMRRVAERLLQRNGYRVITAKDGLDAIGQLQNESPAAILLDIEMPRVDGFEVAGFVRNNERIQQTPIIMITSRSGDKHRTRAASLGVDRYLIKPYQEEQLLQELRALLQAREAEAA